jgi:hypothetical protein
MARMSKSMNFKNCTLSLEDMTLVEIGKDTSEEFDLMEVLKQWDGVEGLSISIKKDKNLVVAEAGE